MAIFPTNKQIFPTNKQMSNWLGVEHQPDIVVNPFFSVFSILINIGSGKRSIYGKTPSDRTSGTVD